MKILLNKGLYIALLVFFLTIPKSFAQEISGDTKVCHYSTTTYTVSNLPTGSTSGKWSVTNGTISGDADKATVTILWNGSGAATVTYNYSLNDVPKYVDKNDITVIGPTGILGVTADPPSFTICQGGAIKLTAAVSGIPDDASGDPATTFSYSWNGGSKTGASITEHPGLGNTVYSVTATDNICSDYTYTKSFNVKVNPNPVVTTGMTGTTPLCPGSSSVTLTASASNGATSFTWTPPTGLGVPTATTNTSSVVASPTVSTTYAAKGTNSYGCSTTNYITVPVHPYVAVEASTKVKNSPDGFMCKGGSVILTASNANSYSWNNMSSLTVNTSNGSSVTARPSSTTTYTVSGVINGCTTTTTRRVVVGLTPNKPTIAGPSELCYNPPTQTYNVPIGNTYDPDDVPVYTWSVSPSYFATFVGSNIGQTCTIDFNNTFTGTGYLYLTVSNRCGSQQSSHLINIASSVPAAPTVSGPSTACKGTSSSFNIGHMTHLSTWEVTPIEAVASSSTSPYGIHNVNWNPNFTGTAYVRAKLRNGCGSSAWSSTKSVSIPNGFIFNGHTILPQIPDSNFAFAKGDFNRDGILDIYAIKKYNGGTYSTEVHILNGATNYTSYLLNVPTPWGPTGNTYEFQVGDFNADRIPDLYIIRKQPTHTYNTEVHVLNGATNYSSYLLQVVTIAPKTDSNSNFVVGDYNLDGVLDLYHISKNGNSSPRIYANILDGRTNFTSSLGRFETAMPETFDNVKFLLNTHGTGCKPDLVAITKNPVSNAPSPIKILSGNSNYASYQKETSITLDGSYEKVDFILGDRSGNVTGGYQDLFFIKKTQTYTAYTSVHVLNGNCYFSNCGSSAKLAVSSFEESDVSFDQQNGDIGTKSAIFPNPISEGRVSFTEKAAVFQLFDAKGTLVKTGVDTDGFNVDGLHKGIYFIKIDGRSEKLIVE